MAQRSEREQLSPRAAAVRIIRTLREAKQVAYLAGGCVRDELLGRVPSDYDVATDAPPDRVHALFRRSRYVGESFGVVQVHMGGQAVEVATFRSEWGYSDKRRPDHVVFTDAQHDAQRRDFTINGLFADPLDTDPATGGDRIIDYVGGRADLAAGLIRAIGDPDARFGEDYLRMLRAVRFAARLDFAIEPGTAAAIRALAPHLGQISRERIGQEMQAMLSSPGAARAATLAQQLQLDGPALNEEPRDATPATLAALDEEAAYSTRLAAWMLDRHVAWPTDQQARPVSGAEDGGEDEAVMRAVARFAQREGHAVVRRWRAALCLSNASRDMLGDLLALLTAAAQWPALSVAQRKRLLAQPAWPETLRLLRALPAGAWTARIERESTPLLTEGVAPRALLSGEDLIAIGLTPGPPFRRLLDEVYDAQLEGKVRNREQALAWVRDEGLRGAGWDGG